MRFVFYSCRLEGTPYMRKLFSASVRYSLPIIFMLMLLSSTLQAQVDPSNLVEDDEEVRKNVLAVRPLGLLTSMYGIYYERHIAGRFSAVLYAEYGNGPFVFKQMIFNNVRRQMDATVLEYKFVSYGGAPEVRYYFKKANSLRGWYVGVYAPIRRIDIKIETRTTEVEFFGRQNDYGVFEFKSWHYGLGPTGGWHYVSDRFSFDAFIGVAGTNGFNPNQWSPALPFEYSRPGIGEYSKVKSVGMLGWYMFLAPRIGISLGVAF